MHKKNMFWIALLYVAQGLPYGVYAEILPVYLRGAGVDLRQIGFLSLIGLAWTLKFLWAPLIEKWGNPSRWVAAMLLGFALFNGLIPLLPIQADTLPVLLLIIACMALASATNDIAIDGYSIRLLNGQDIGKANGVRVAAYRVGLLLCGGLLLLNRWFDWTFIFMMASVALAGLAVASWAAPKLPRELLPPPITLGEMIRQTRAQYARMPFVFVGLSGLLFVFVLWLVDRVPRKAPYVDVGAWLQPLGWQAGASPWPWIWLGVTLLGLMLVVLHHRKRAPLPAALSSADLATGGLMAMFLRPHMPAVFLFILLFKLADSSMGFMIKPFWVDSGFSADQIGLVSVNVGIALSIVGAMVGGWYTDRVGIYKSLWVMACWQMASNGVYAWVAWKLPDVTPDQAGMRQALIYSASAFESFTGGLGTASFLALLMALVHPRFATTEYAALSAIFAASRSVAGFLSGFGAHYFGYAPYFALTMFMGLPAFLLLPWVKKALQNPIEKFD